MSFFILFFSGTNPLRRIRLDAPNLLFLIYRNLEDRKKVEGGERRKRCIWGEFYVS